MGAPSDARLAPGGEVWWVDQENDQLNQLVADTDIVTRWDIPASTLFGTAIDSNDAVWMTDYFQPNLYRFDLDASLLYSYTFGTSGASDYILANDGKAWLGDWINDGIHCLDLDTSLLTIWELPFNARPVGLAMDSQGNFWWADSDRRELDRLEIPTWIA